MDSALLKEYNAFKKRNLASHDLEKARKPRPSLSKGDIQPGQKKRRQQDLPHQLLQQAKKQAVSQTFNYKTHTQIRAKGRFSILSNIVDLLRSRYQSKVLDPLSLDELLDITKNTDIKPADREWLDQESLKHNPKVSCRDGKYCFNPKFSLKDKKSLLRLLDKHEQGGLGGVLLDDVRECLSNADEEVKAVSDKIIFVTRSNDKKAILFNYDPSYAVQVDEEFQKHWRSVAVEGLGEPDIEKYLSNSGISSMQGVLPSQKKPEKSRRNVNRKRNLKLQNVHLGGEILKDYSDMGKKSK